MFTRIQNIITAIAALKALLGLIEPITALIKQVEQPGNGPEKKAAVLSLIKASLDTVESVFKIDLPEGMVMSFAGSIIDVIVAVQNALGAFKSETATAST